MVWFLCMTQYIVSHCKASKKLEFTELPLACVNDLLEFTLRNKQESQLFFCLKDLNSLEICAHASRPELISVWTRQTSPFLKGKCLCESLLDAHEDMSVQLTVLKNSFYNSLLIALSSKKSFPRISSAVMIDQYPWRHEEGNSISFDWIRVKLFWGLSKRRQWVLIK